MGMKLSPFAGSDFCDKLVFLAIAVALLIDCCPHPLLLLQGIDMFKGSKQKIDCLVFFSKYEYN